MPGGLFAGRAEGRIPPGDPATPDGGIALIWPGYCDL